MMKPVFSLIAISALMLPANGMAQTAEFDSSLGKYRLTYHSGYLGRPVVALVEPPNKIDPSLRLIAVEELEGQFSYEYAALNGRGQRSKQPMVEFEFDCPSKQLVEVIPPADWEVGLGRSFDDEGFICVLIEKTADRRAAIAPGQMLRGLMVQTPMLPAVAGARFWGDAEDVQWPEGESMEALEIEVLRAVHRLSGPTGGFVERLVVVPLRDGTDISSLDILQGLEQDLVMICRERIWIQEPLCRSWQTSLTQLTTAVTEDRAGAARDATAALLEEIEAAHRSPEQKLESDAYWLLRKNLEAVFTRLENATPGEHSEVESKSSEGTDPVAAPSPDGAPQAAPGFWSRLWSAIRNLPRA